MEKPGGRIMAGYSPLRITGMASGLVQKREEFLLPDDAYPKLRNAYVWRERIKRKQGTLLLGRLQRKVAVANALTAGSINLKSVLGLESTATIVPGSISLIGSADGTTYTDPNENGTLTATGGTGTGGTINYVTGVITILAGGGETLTGTVDYYPGLPVMGIRTREQQNSLQDQTIFFDQKYAYVFDGASNAFEEFIPGTTWNASNETVAGASFFWSTNWWVSQTTIPGTETPLFTTSNRKLFWETNNTGQFGGLADPPRITDGVTWVNFYDDGTPANTPWAQIDATSYLVNWLSMLPFRGRLVTFNTWEGTNATNAANYPNRIRWSTIGNPFIPYAAGPPATGSWRDDIRGQGGFLDIPTSEDIISIGFVRDNLVIYCEHSTWQLRYTGRSIAPFQVERVNSELGGEGPFSAIQFDTSLIGVGDKGIVECDSYKSDRIDIKILDFVFEIQNENNGPRRVHGIRDFINRLAFWTVPLSAEYDAATNPDDDIFPNIRLVYNYENDSWAIFTDSLTTLGTYQPQSSRTWLTTPIPWDQCNFSWVATQAMGQPDIVGGNQQGYVEYLDYQTTNDVSLSITGVEPNTTSPTVITSPNHNFQTGMVIGIRDIPSGTPYDNLNGGVYAVVLGDNAGLQPQNKFRLFTYNATNNQFSTPQLDVPDGDYVGLGQIYIRDNFNIVSKKFNFLDEGQNIQFGYLDILMDATPEDEPGAISLNVYLDYNDIEATNTLPNNRIVDATPQGIPDTFFNSVIPTSNSAFNQVGGSKFWTRVYCPTRGNFITLEYTFSNAQMAGEEQGKNVQIDATVLWLRRAGRMQPV
jgi:hypothetical protein